MDYNHQCNPDSHQQHSSSTTNIIMRAALRLIHFFFFITFLLKIITTMAKGSFLMGTVRGKLGDMVLARTNGQQVQRAYIAQVKNPKTKAQVVQRALFLAAVKFFTRGNQALFKFAFEDKKTNESDYNAFMRNNVKLGAVMSKAQFDNYGYPAIGPYMITKGSLADFACEVNGPQGVAYSGVPMRGAEIPTTVGALSDILVSGGLYEYGDIITMLFINSYSSDGKTLPFVNPTAAYNTRWEIKQFVLTSGDERALSEFGMRVINETTYRPNGLAMVFDIIGDGDAASGFAVIHSRNTPTGLKVSTQTLAMDDATRGTFDYMMTDAYINEVVASYQQQDSQSDPQYILQGSLAPAAINSLKDFFPTAPMYLRASQLPNGGDVEIADYPTQSDFDATKLTAQKSANVSDVVLANKEGKLVATITYTSSTDSQDFGVQVLYNGAMVANIQGSTVAVVIPEITRVLVNGSELTTNVSIPDNIAVGIETINVEDGCKLVVTPTGSAEVGTTLDLTNAQFSVIADNAASIAARQYSRSIAQHIYVVDADNKVILTYPNTFTQSFGDEG